MTHVLNSVASIDLSATVKATLRQLVTNRITSKQHRGLIGVP